MKDNLRNSVPVKPLLVKPVLIAVNKWEENDGILSRAFKFPNTSSRNYFIEGILEREEQSQHPIKFIVTEKQVIVKLTTQNLKQVTDVDNETATWLSQIYKDAVYTHIDE